MRKKISRPSSCGAAMVTGNDVCDSLLRVSKAVSKVSSDAPQVRNIDLTMDRCTHLTKDEATFISAPAEQGDDVAKICEAVDRSETAVRNDINKCGLGQPKGRLGHLPKLTPRITRSIIRHGASG